MSTRNSRTFFISIATRLSTWCGMRCEHPFFPKKDGRAWKNNCELSFSQLAGHLDHRPPEAEPGEQSLGRSILFRRPQNDARRSLLAKPSAGRFDQRRADSAASMFLTHHDVVNKTCRLA